MKKLLIDLDICGSCGECRSVCSYVHHPENNGITNVMEVAHFAVVCRRCDEAPCVGSCPWQAIELQPYNMLKRYLMRCTSCKSCSRACPFGVIYADTIPYLTSRCDLCIGRLRENEMPICLQTCSHNGVKYGEFTEDLDAHVYQVSEQLLVKTNYKWEREPLPAKKR